MNEVIYLKYPFKTESIVTGYKYHRKSTNTYRIQTIASSILGIFYLGQGLYDLASNFNLGSFIPIALGVYCLSFNRISIYFFARNYKKLNYDNKITEWEISDEKIIHRMISLSELTFSWELVKGILDTPKGFLIYPQQHLFYWLPKSKFSSEEDIAHFAFIAKNNVKNWQQIK